MLLSWCIFRRRDSADGRGAVPTQQAPKIQRLITPQLQRKRYFKVWCAGTVRMSGMSHARTLGQAITRKRMEAGKEAKAAYAQRLIEYHHEQREAHAAEMAKKKKKNA